MTTTPRRRTRITPPASAGPIPTALTARSPEDLLAVVPVVLGFVPQDSVVMLTFGAERAFHARVDLPHEPSDIPEIVSVLLDPARRHGVRRVVFVIYSADGQIAGRTARSLVKSFGAAGIEVVDALRADGHTWFALADSRRGVPDCGVAYDVSAHPFLAQAVFDGRVTHGSRSDLAATLVSDAAAVADVTNALTDLVEAGCAVDESRWVTDLVGRHLVAGTSPDPTETARLLSALLDVEVRDAAWSLMTRADARDQIRLWTDIVRRCPSPMLAAPAALVGFAAWLAGHGALAWCAIDRCREVDPDYRMATYLAQALTQAVPPSVWEHPQSEDPR